MARPKGRIRPLFETLSFSKAHFGSAKATKMNHSQLFEEERLPWYSTEQFYPVRMGDIFIAKYKVVGKLGYGAHSTVWLCRDTKSIIPPMTIATSMLTGSTEILDL